MVLRLHAPLRFREEDPRARAPPHPHTVLARYLFLRLFSPSCRNFFCHSSRSLDRRRVSFPRHFRHGVSRSLSLLSFSVDLVPVLLRTVSLSLSLFQGDYVTGYNVKYETLHPAVSLESKRRVREMRLRVSGRVYREIGEIRAITRNVLIYTRICDGGHGGTLYQFFFLARMK